MAAVEQPRYRVRRFDADRRDRELSLEEAIASRPRSRQLLWIDVLGAIEPADMEALGKRFEFDEATRRVLETSTGRPNLAVHGSYFHLCVAAEPGIKREPDELWLDVVASPNVVITRHAGALELLDEVDRPDQVGHDARRRGGRGVRRRPARRRRDELLRGGRSGR